MMATVFSVDSPASVYLSPTFSSSSLGLGGGHTACRRPGVRSSLSVGEVSSVCGQENMRDDDDWNVLIFTSLRKIHLSTNVDVK